MTPKEAIKVLHEILKHEKDGTIIPSNCSKLTISALEIAIEYLSKELGNA